MTARAHRVLLCFTASLALLWFTRPAHAYHSTAQQAGHKHHAPEGAKYTTAHGHEMPQHAYAPSCIDAALKACMPHLDIDHDHYQRRAPVSELYRCLASRTHKLPRRCHDWAVSQTGCVDDIEKFCPHLPLGKTLECIDKHHAQLSETCTHSSWYRHQHPHHHARVSALRHHHDPEHEDPVEVEVHHLEEDHGYDVDTHEAFSDL